MVSPSVWSNPRFLVVVASFMAWALSGETQNLRAAGEEKVHSVGKDGLTLESKLEADDPKVKIVVALGKEGELPAKLFLVKLMSGKKYRIAMDSKEFDSFLVIQDKTGRQLAFDDDSGGDLNALINLTVDKDDTYKIYTASNNQNIGNFTLKVQEAGADRVHSVGKDGLTLEGKIDAADTKIKVVPAPDVTVAMPAKLYQVKLMGGKKYRITLDSTDIDSFLLIQDNTGKQLAFDDDSGGGLNSLLTWEAPKDGTYRIYAASLKGTGAFTLKVLENKAD